MKILMCAFVFAAALLPLHAAEYFVSVQGSDTNEGVSQAAAFATLQKGLDALAPGDTLTILPGEYFESVQRANLGSNDMDTIIRAAIPGTVLLRGDVSAPAFTKVDGYRFVHAADFAQPVMAVNEVDTLMTMGKSANVRGVEHEPGTFYYDSEQHKLYISSTDLRPPVRHRYTVSVNQNHGLYLEDPCRVIVEGLSFTGFNTDTALGWGANSTKCGLLAIRPIRCVVQECTAFLNSAGLMLSIEGVGLSNVIERCVAYGNYSALNGEGCNIQILGPNFDIIRDCYGYLGRDHNISMYGRVKDARQTGLIKNCLAWGAWLDIQQKGGFYGIAENTVALNWLRSQYMKNCLYGVWGYPTAPAPDSVNLNDYMASRNAEFADPDNLDFRLQSTSRLRGQGTNGTDLGAFQYQSNIYYVATNGHDAADGLSVGTAWKTLPLALSKVKRGDTLYLEPGTYTGGPMVGATNITIRGRGVAPVTILQPFALQQGSGVTLERLHLAEAMSLTQAHAVHIRNCTLAGLRAEGVKGLRMEHGVFTVAPELNGCTEVFLRGNIYATGVQVAQSQITYSDYNSYPDEAALQKMPDRYSLVMRPEIGTVAGVSIVKNAQAFGGRGPLGTALGLYHEFRKQTFPLAGPFVHSVSATTANLEWWTSQPAETEIAWGDTPDCVNTQRIHTEPYTTFSLSGLQPGQTYYFLLKAITAKPNTSFAQVMEGMAGKVRTVEFKTAAMATEPRTYYVAPDGRVANTGLSREQAWPTIGQAADRVNAGDTVLIAGGRYKETAQIRATGGQGRPITFKSLPGEKVILDGDKRSLGRAIQISGKHYLVFDGLYFTGHGYGAAIVMSDCREIVIRRCFFRQEGAVHATNCSNLLLENCVLGGAMEGIHLRSCANVRFEHNVSSVHLIMHANIANLPTEKVYFANNILTDNQIYKLPVCMYEIARFDSIVDTNNCYFLRMPDDQRKPFLFCNYEQGASYGPAYAALEPPAIHGRVSVQDYHATMGFDGRTLFCDPRFKGLEGVEIPPYQDVANKLWIGLNIASNTLAAVANGQPGFPPDRMPADSDFDAYFATNPEVIARGMGLQPEAFADFNFDQPAWK